MTALSTIVRATHLLTNAAWFGGTLAGAVAIDPASKEEAGSGRERAQLLDEGWRRWGPVQGAAIGLHLVSGLGILADNRHRVLGHRPTTAAVVAKTVLTGVAVVMSAEAYRSRAELREALERADTGEGSREKAQALTQRMGWVQWGSSQSGV